MKSAPRRFFAVLLPMAVLLTAITAGSASAATIGTIPAGTVTNDFPALAGEQLEGIYGKTLTSGGGTITVEIFGWDADYENNFVIMLDGAPVTFGSDSGIGSGPGTTVFGTYPGTPLGSASGTIAPGSVDFQFIVNGVLGVANGSNPDGTDVFAGINFFVSFDGDGLDFTVDGIHPLSGSSVLLFLDDGGGEFGVDGDYDDLVIRLSGPNFCRPAFRGPRTGEPPAARLGSPGPRPRAAAPHSRIADARSPPSRPVELLAEPRDRLVGPMLLHR